MSAVSLAVAQVGSATISGRVTDPTGAVIPGAKVTVVNTETNFQFTTSTNTEGLFRVPSLQPGPYRASFEAGGFRRLVRDALSLRTGDTLAVDVSLEVGNIAESIEVTAAAPLLETEISSTGTVAEGQYLYKLPLHERYVNATLHLVPGMTASGYAYAKDLSSYHIAGLRNGAIGLFEDGVVGNDQMGGTSTLNPIENAVAEVKVLTTALPAEYGHSAGGVISVVKKTGTNEWHGLASFYGRGPSMAHRGFFTLYKATQPTATTPNPADPWYELPDFNTSGPVLIPKLYNGRNRTFFFFANNKLIGHDTSKTGGGRQYIGTTPTPEMKAGDFSFGGIGNPLFDPASTRQVDGKWVRDPFPGSRIPIARFDPVAKKVLELDPWRAPTLPGTFNANGPVDNLLYRESSKGTAFDEYSARIDHQFNPNLKVSGSYTYNNTSGWGRYTNIKLLDFDATNGNETPFTQQNYSIGTTWVINPATINDARIGYLRRRNDRRVPSFGKNYGQILGIPNISAALLPSFGSGGEFSPDSIYGLTVSGPSRMIGETLSFRNDLTRIQGPHAFKMGYEVLRHRLNSTVTNRPSGDFRFDGMTAGLQADGNTVPRTGNTFAGFLLGLARQAQFDSELASWLPRSHIHSFYFQDDWKVTPTLTLNLGVRYSNESPFGTKYGQMSNFSPTAVDDVVAGNVGGIIHPNGGLNTRDNNNFQPRIGAAWHPVKKWVVRGGFAVNTVDVKFPSSRVQFEEYVAITNQQRAPGDPRPLFALSRGPDPIAFSIRQNGTSGFLGTNYGSRGSEWWDPNLRNPYVLNWNLNAQYELTPNYLVEVLYQGSAGVGLIERWQTNTFAIDYAKSDPVLQAAVYRTPQNYRPFPQFGDIRMRSNFGHSTYHSGTVKLEKRFSRGFTFLTFYTFSKAIDSQDNDNDGTGVAPIQNRSLEKARAGYDRNHRYVGSTTFELPVGKGKRFLNRGGIWNHILGGYELAWIQTLESGNPLTFGFANSPYNYYPTFAGNRRPNVVSTPQLRDNWRDFGGDRFNLQNINPIIDMNYFAYPAAFTAGNAGRSILTGTPLIWSQVSAKKNLRFFEKYELQLRLDYNNVLKTWNFNPPTTSVDYLNPKTFGKVSAEPRTANFGGLPMMNMKIQFTW